MSNPARHLLVWGMHAACTTLQLAPLEVLEVWLREGPTETPELTAALASAAAHGVSIQRVSGKTLDRLADGGVHQGLVLRRRMPKPWDLAMLQERVLASTASPLLLVLDQVQDPHNLGACMRVADGAGAHAIVLTRDHSVSLTSAAAKVASGALETIPLVYVNNLARALAQLKEAGVWVVGTAHDAPRSVHAADLNRPLALVMGAEGRGLRRLTRDTCDELVAVPMLGAVASLNLGTAAAVCLFETMRQRNLG